MPPVVTSVSPTQGPTSGGTTVTITGTSLTGATAVRFGSANASSYTVNSSTRITAVTPPGGAGAVPVTVVSPSGSSNTTVSFTYTVVLPSVTGVSPVSGPTSGGTAVTLTGANLSGATAVRFGAANAASFTVTSPTQITAVSPPGSPGAVPVTVTTPAGTSAASPGAYYFYAPAPVLSEISPGAGPAAGGASVTLSGQNLSNATAVQFATSGSVFTVLSSTEIVATAPPGLGTVSVTVTTPGGSSNPLAYAYVSAPVLTAVSPPTAGVSAGTVVTLTGTGLTTTTSVTIGGAAVAFVVLSDSQLTAAVPAGPPGAAAIEVTTAAGTAPALVFHRVEPPGI
ncbi:IPT/TIG domain-containing protein [Streptomyces sp. SS7]|uniref:IPT/TIG domain-containing protein n=1 Tax=Streptomyces sp. SS7 TaxID=3108485 RepID=UPI0030EBA6B2